MSPTPHSLPTWMLNEYLRDTQLTYHEQQVLRCLARGLTIAETAEALGVGYETVKTRARLARGRLMARNTTHAVAIAISRDLI